MYVFISFEFVHFYDREELELQHFHFLDKPLFHNLELGQDQELLEVPRISDQD